MHRKTVSTIALLAAALCMQQTASATANYFTEYFSPGTYDLGGIQIVFEPTAEITDDYYEITEVTAITELPINTFGRSAVAMSEYYAARIPLPVGKTFTFYGNTYDVIFLSPNGLITFINDLYDPYPSLSTHFNYYPTIAPFWAHLDPSESTGGGKVYAFELEIGGTPRGYVISFENVQAYGDSTATCSFQCVMYYGGAILMAWTHESFPYSSLVGLSRGTGYPSPFFETDLSENLISEGDPNDMDGDGLPDSWENFYFGSYTNCAPNGHGDTDGFDNESEYIAGTIPNDASSYFIVDYSMGGSQIVVHWSSLTGRTYSVQHAESLTAPFTNLVTGITPTPPMNSYTSIVGSAEESGYFKASVELAP